MLSELYVKTRIEEIEREVRRARTDREPARRRFTRRVLPGSEIARPAAGLRHEVFRRIVEQEAPPAPPARIVSRSRALRAA
jgi:hypothetical protein